MNKLVFTASGLFLLTLWILGSLLTGSVSASLADPEGGSGIVAAATAFLHSLDDAQREKTSFDFKDRERFNWHFIPRERKGLPLREMNEAQRAKLQSLLGTALSEIGVKTVNDIRFLESVLRKLEGPRARFDRDPELYYLSCFGKPGKKARWGWRFEGHHVSLNFTLQGDRVLSATPMVLGANPSRVQDGSRKGLRVLAGVEDLARQLMNSLDEEQLKSALGKEEPMELKGMQAEKYTGPLPAGVAASQLDREQRQLLRRLVLEYLRHLDGDVAAAIREEIQAAGGRRIQIAWRGGLKPLEKHSYIVHGPTFVISYANFQGGATHIHAGFRDTTGEFGLE